MNDESVVEFDMSTSRIESLDFDSFPSTVVVRLKASNGKGLVLRLGWWEAEQLCGALLKYLNNSMAIEAEGAK